MYTGSIIFSPNISLIKQLIFFYFNSDKRKKHICKFLHKVVNILYIFHYHS